MNAISLNLNFAGAVLPVVDCEDGFQRVPLKPICDAMGVEWRSQQRRFGGPAGGITPPQVGENEPEQPPSGSYLTRLLGVCVGDIPYAGQTRQMVLIRLDRVAGFLLTINPERVRAAGNEDGAAFLERKHQEWLDLIHAYEQRRGDLFSDRSVRKAMAIARIDRMRDPMLKRLALAEIGIDFDSGKPVAGGTGGDLFGQG